MTIFHTLWTLIFRWHQSCEDTVLMRKWCLVVYHISVQLIQNSTRVFFPPQGGTGDTAVTLLVQLFILPYLAFFKFIYFLSDFLLSYTNCVCLSPSFHQNLRKMEAESSEEPGRDLNELQNDDWVGNWTSDLWPPASADLKSSSLKANWGNHMPLWFHIEDSSWLHVHIEKSLWMHVTLWIGSD